MAYSMVFNDFAGANELQVKVKPFPTPRITPALSWAQDTAGNWHVTDRGANEDVHEADVVFHGTATQMNALADWLEAYGREKFKITAFDGTVFAPLLKHDTTVNCTLVNLGRMRQAFATSTPSNDIYELSATLRALAPAWVNTPASLASLRLQQGFEADKSTEVRKLFYYDTNAYFVDEGNDNGRFTGTFRQRKTETESILRYLLTDSRGKVMSFPSLPGVTYPFGKARGQLPKKCRMKSVSVHRANLKTWELKIEFVEEREIV